MTDGDKTPGAPHEEEGAAEPPRKPRPKMTLDEQACFLASILDACIMRHPDSPRRGEYAGHAMLTLTNDQILQLETVWQTLRVFDLHRADLLVKDKIDRERRWRRK
jgi:hypothetical protein